VDNRDENNLDSTIPEPSEHGDEDSDHDAANVAAAAAATTAPQQRENQVVQAIHLLKEKGQAIGSRDVAAALSKPLFDSQKLHLPVGHNMPFLGVDCGPI
jgi:hypothetical protein